MLKVFKAVGLAAFITEVLQIVAENLNPPSAILTGRMLTYLIKNINPFFEYRFAFFYPTVP